MYAINDRTHLRTRRAAYPLAYTIESEDKPQNVKDMKKLSISE